MSDEEIENLLRAQPAPELPAAWRTTILREAAARVRQRPSGAFVLAWLARVIARNPRTSSGLGLMWLLILLLRGSTPVDLQERGVLARAEPKHPLDPLQLVDQIRLVDALEQPVEEPPARVP